MSGHVFLGPTSTKQGLMCLAQGHNTVKSVRLEPTTPQSRVKQSTTEPPYILESTFTNSEDPDEMQHYAAFHLGLHCLLRLKQTFRDRNTP